MRRGRLGIGAFVIGGLVVVLALVLVVRPWASDAPDGLERVAIDEGFAADADPPVLDGVDDDLGAGLAGVIGVVVAFGLAGGAVLVARRVGRRRRPSVTSVA